MTGLSARLSRYTPAVFACALINLLLAEGAVLAGLTWPGRALLAPTTLAVVHLVTVGWLTLLMFGALFQFVPVIANRALPSQRLVLAMLIAWELGVASLVVGFAGLDHGWGVLLPMGGGLVIVATLAGIADVLPPLVAARKSLPARCVLVGCGFLVLTLLLGLCFALALRFPAVARHAAPLLGRGLPAHLLAGLGGWFTLTAIGVSYKLLPMFMLAPEERGALGDAVLAVTAGGFALAVVAVIAQAFVGGVFWVGAESIGLASAGLGCVLYLVDVLRMYRTRRRATLELQNRASILAFAALSLCLPLALAWRAHGDMLAPALVVLTLAGWLSGLALTQLYKIVAFLSWLVHYGSALGRGRVPRVQDLVDERRAQPWFGLFFLGVTLLTAGAVVGSPWIFRAGAGLCLAATLAVTLEYWRSWHVGDLPAKSVSVPSVGAVGRPLHPPPR